MSTSTQMEFNVTPEYRVKTDFTQSGKQVMNLDRLLGEEGRRSFERTLESLEQRGAPLPGEGEGILNWERVAEAGQRGAHYRLRVPAENLSGVEGLSEVVVHLRMHGALTEVTHEASFSRVRTSTETSANASLSSTEQQSVQRVVNRSVNQLLAYGVAERLKNQLKEQVKDKLQVRNEQRLNQLVAMRVTNKINIQTFARLRQ